MIRLGCVTCIVFFPFTTTYSRYLSSAALHTISRCKVNFEKSFAPSKMLSTQGCKCFLLQPSNTLVLFVVYAYNQDHNTIHIGLKCINFDPTKIHNVTMQVGILIAIHFLQVNTKICVIHDPPNISFDFTQRIHFCCCIESKTWRPRPKIRGCGCPNWKTWKVRSVFVDFVPIYSLTQLIKRLTRWRQST